ncbi:MAG: beta-ketoacyl-[acyl-carrier-protein] synthase family protein [Propionibacteriaceae bacterium]|jgi:3-oxoacyl-[acyl-carrier-protein] synthase II|nr:beta-ketoacyl-[acyl-carrier-protein] synthase family protein [Propionibacteriaceae bacterium]
MNRGADNSATARRVVVTGLGPVSSIGLGSDAFRQAILSGQSGAKPIRAFPTAGFDSDLACEVDQPTTVADPTGRWGRAAAFAVEAAQLALADARLEARQLRASRVTVAVGTTDGESQDLDHLAQTLLTEPWSALDADLARRVHPLNLSLAVAADLGLADVDLVTIATACSAGNYAIGYGFDAIMAGEADYALVGGSDALCRKTFTGFYRLGTIAPDACRPFDADRLGLLTGEGAGLMVLEERASAQARGAPILAEVVGYALSCDAQHAVAPDVDGIVRCVSKALALAGLAPEDVDLISAHGTGTKANDVTECAALERVYGSAIPPTVSLKSMLGHAMGAASALGAIGCVIALASQVIPPTINHRRTDPDCHIDCVPNVARPAALDIVANHGLAFGGNNAIVLFRRAGQA